MKFYISQDGAQKGPWAAEEISHKLNAREINWTDYLFDEGSKEWVLLMEHPHFEKTFKESLSRPQAKPAAPFQPHYETRFEKEWFVLKGENKYGPFTFVEVVKMLQEKSLYEYDFVWNSAMTSWSRIAEIKDFHPENIRALKDNGANAIRDVFFRRRYARANYNASIIVHNSKSVFKGTGLEISPGGAGVSVESSIFEPGQTLFLHYKAGDGVPPFNAICSVISKQHGVDASGFVRYGVKFTNISQSVQQAIKDFTDKKVA